MTTCYIGTDLLVYYEEGDNSQRVVPDVFVALGVKNQPRMTYQTWNEGKAPDFVLEVASLSTTKHDELAKWGLYQMAGGDRVLALGSNGNPDGPAAAGLAAGAGSVRATAATDG